MIKNDNIACLDKNSPFSQMNMKTGHRTVTPLPLCLIFSLPVQHFRKSYCHFCISVKVLIGCFGYNFFKDPYLLNPWIDHGFS